jgi:hypothetical protein
MLILGTKAQYFGKAGQAMTFLTSNIRPSESYGTVLNLISAKSTVRYSDLTKKYS